MEKHLLVHMFGGKTPASSYVWSCIAWTGNTLRLGLKMCCIISVYIYVTFSFYIVSSLSLRKSVCSSMNEKLILNYHTKNIVIICVRENFLEMEFGVKRTSCASDTDCVCVHARACVCEKNREGKERDKCENYHHISNNLISTLKRFT